MIPVSTPMGLGTAFAVIDYSQEHFLHFVVGLDSDGSIHIFDNRDVKLQWNPSLGRIPHDLPAPAKAGPPEPPPVAARPARR